MHAFVVSQSGRRMKRVVFTFCTATIVQGVHQGVIKKRKYEGSDVGQGIATTVSESGFDYSDPTASPERLNALLGHSVPRWFHKALVAYIDQGATDQSIFDAALDRFAFDITRDQANELAGAWILMCVVPLRLHARGLLEQVPCRRSGSEMSLSSEFTRALDNVRFADDLPRIPLPIDQEHFTTAQITASVVLNNRQENEITVTQAALELVEGSSLLSVTNDVLDYVFTTKALSFVRLSSFVEFVNSIGTDREPIPAEDVPEHSRLIVARQLELWKQVYAESLVEFYREPLGRVCPIAINPDDRVVVMRDQFGPIFISKVPMWLSHRK